MDEMDSSQEESARTGPGCALAGLASVLGSVLLGGYFGGWFDSKADYQNNLTNYSQVSSSQPSTPRDRRIPETQPADQDNGRR